MQFDYFEGIYGMEVRMTPENSKECAELLRISNNASSEKPSIYFSFESDTPSCAIWINKRKPAVQKNTIRP